MAVNDPVINGSDSSGINDVQCLAGNHRNVQMTGQAVSGTAGNDSHGCPGMNECTADFIDGAVSSDSNNNVDSIPGSFGSYLGGMSGILGALDGIVIFRMVNLFLDQLWNCFFAVSSGNGIDDENNSFFQAHVSSLAWFRSTKIILFA